MARLVTFDGQITLDAIDLATVGEVNGYTLKLGGNVLSTQGFSSRSMLRDAGIKDNTLTVEFIKDDQGSLESNFNAKRGTTLAWTVTPDRVNPISATNPTRTGSSVFMGWDDTHKAGDYASTTIELPVDGDVVLDITP